MKSTQTCPKCAGRKFAVTPEFRQPDQQTGSATWPLPAITVPLGPASPGQVSDSKRIAYGLFETWICLACGFTEFYAHGLEGIEHSAKQWPDRVHIVDAEPPERGPYR